MQLKERGIENEKNTLCKIGLDDGRGKLKISLSAITKHPEEEEKTQSTFKVREFYLYISHLLL